MARKIKNPIVWVFMQIGKGLGLCFKGLFKFLFGCCCKTRKPQESHFHAREHNDLPAYSKTFKYKSSKHEFRHIVPPLFLQIRARQIKKQEEKEKVENLPVASDLNSGIDFVNSRIFSIRKRTIGGQNHANYETVKDREDHDSAPSFERA